MPFHVKALLAIAQSLASQVGQHGGPHLNITLTSEAALGGRAGLTQHIPPAQSHPISTQSHHTSTQSHPTSTQSHPTSTGHHTSTQSYPTSTQSHHTSTQSYPTSTQSPRPHQHTVAPSPPAHSHPVPTSMQSSRLHQHTVTPSPPAQSPHPHPPLYPGQAGSLP